MSQGRLTLVVGTIACAATGLVLWLAAPFHGEGAPGSDARRAAQSASAPMSRPAEAEAAAPARDGLGPVLQALRPGRRMPGGDAVGQEQDVTPRIATGQAAPAALRQPREDRFRHAASWDGDVRALPPTPPRKIERPEREEPMVTPRIAPGSPPGGASTQSEASVSFPNAPAPAPTASFAGLDFANWGAGHPPDTNGDVGPTYYIQTINSSIGIFDKSTGTRVAAFSFNTFMSQGQFGNLCDTDNFGDPVVLYDSFEDRWFITDFAFQLDLSGNVPNPPGAYQCVAASKSGDPVSGGWNFYSLHLTDYLNDYPKFGVWSDGIYMSSNLFEFKAGGSYISPRVWALNKAQMYAGAPTVQVVSFDGPSADFTLLPANARLQTGNPPPGTPSYFVSTEEYLNALTVYKFHVDWARTSLSTFTGPDIPLAATSRPNASVPNAPELNGTSLDTLQIRAMAQNQYTRRLGVESLWTAQTVRRADTNGFAAPRWYQTDVTGGTVAANLLQAATWDPDAANVMYRYMPSLALNRNGDLAMGYSTSNSTTYPAIKYAGRLAGDAVNTFSLTEQLLVQGTGAQTTTNRWGDYSSMTLDPDGCTFWYTNEYYLTNGSNHQTRIGSFIYPGCTTLGNGTLTGTVTRASNGSPISGATVMLGSRSTTTNASGVYTFIVPDGIYPVLTASMPGFVGDELTNIAVGTGGTTQRDFALNAAATSGCFVDSAQSDFQTGVTNCDMNTTPGSVTLASTAQIDQQNLTTTTHGFGFTSTGWAGQTFTPSVTGSLTRMDLDLFCSGCTGTTPNITVSIRATSGSPAVPTGADLATATITGFSSGSGGFFSANFSSPPALTAGVHYAIVIRAVSNPSAGTYAFVCSCTPDTNPYIDGQIVSSTNSGASWVADTTAGGRDLGFKAYMLAGYTSPGVFTSSAKDANPPTGVIPTWGTIAWTATTPANTSVTFQVAASNSPNGPFTFVGPDGTGGTFFANGGSLAQFNGSRYLEYRATLTTSNAGVTPSLQDVTVCFADTNGSAPVVTADPSSTVVTSGNRALFRAAAAGTPTPTVQWQVSTNGGGTFTDIAGATATSYSVAVTAPDNGKQFRAVFTNTAGGATTNAATLTVSSLGNVAPVVTLHPSNQNVAAGAGASFTSTASGQPVPQVQWQASKDGANFSNITDGSGNATTLAFAAAASDNGKFFRAVFTNPAGTATSNVASLVVTGGLAPSDRPTVEAPGPGGATPPPSLSEPDAPAPATAPATDVPATKASPAMVDDPPANSPAAMPGTAEPASGRSAAASGTPSTAAAGAAPTARDSAPSSLLLPPLVNLAAASAVRMALDTLPENAAAASTVRLTGWALDLGAPAGTGVDAVQVWAFPGGDAAPRYLGLAALGADRPDVESVYGRSFRSSGFTASIAGLPPGTYDIVFYVHSSVAGAFAQKQNLRLTIAPPAGGDR